MSLLQGLTFLLGIGSAYASLINTDTQSFTNSSILGPRRLPIIYETYTPPHRSGDDFVITDKRSKNWALRTIDTAHSQAKNLVFRYHPRLGVPVTFAHGMKLKFDVEYTGDLNVGSKQDNVDWYAWVNTTSLKEAWRETKDMGGTKKWNETAPPQLVYVVKGEANGVSGWNIFEKMRYGNDGHWPGRVPASGKEPNGQEKIATPIITGPGGYERGQFYSCTERLNGKLTPGVLRFGWSHGEDQKGCDKVDLLRDQALEIDWDIWFHRCRGNNVNSKDCENVKNGVVEDKKSDDDEEEEEEDEDED